MLGSPSDRRAATSHPARGISLARCAVLFLAISCVLSHARNLSADTIEFLSGSKLEGKVSKIDKEARQVTIEAEISGRTLVRTYPYDKIHAVTLGEKRYVLNEKSGAAKEAGAKDSGKSKPAASSPADGDDDDPAAPKGKPVNRSRAAVERLIDEQGKTPPAWFESTALDYPSTLDLAWPEPPPMGWNNQKNVGQFVWDVVNPNPSRWRSGIKFMHHLLTVHQSDEAKRKRVMQSLASMYFRFFQDYPRAAFWWRKAGVQPGDPDSVALAECYWRLGNTAMATEMLKARAIRADAVKLWGDMGELKQALQMADTGAASFTQQGFSPSPLHLYAGDACRLAGRYADAVRYYQKVVDEKEGLKGRVDQNKKRAAANLNAIRLIESFNPGRLADGAYQAASLGYEGDVKVEVTMRGGKIAEVRVVEHKEKQFYSALTDMPEQIVRKQSVKGVDATSRATVTAEAILNATAKAIADGQPR